MQPNLTNPMLRHPVLLEAVFTPAECQAIIQTGLSYPALEDAYTRQHADYVPGTQGCRRLLHKAEDHGWILQRIMRSAFAVNQQHYRFQIQGMEVPHFCEYQVGQGFDWHMDLTNDQTTNRKLTMVLCLSDPTSFAGGQLHCHPQTARETQQQGNLLIFPAYLMHKVEPVTSGVRYSLITWGIGPPFQ